MAIHGDTGLVLEQLLSRVPSKKAEPWLNLVETPREFYAQITQPRIPKPPENEPLYRWIREQTPQNSVFVTPFLADFWPYAERAQVATIRHAPLDRRLIEWKARLEALNGFRPIAEQGFSDDYISQILEDGKGRLWFAGNRGVFYVRQIDFDDRAAGRIARGAAGLARARGALTSTAW